MAENPDLATDEAMADADQRISEWTKESKTGELRWSKSGVLEERWRVETYGMSTRQYYAGEEVREQQLVWRPIPVEEA